MTGEPTVSVVTIAWRNAPFGASFTSTLAGAAEFAGVIPELVVVVNGPEGHAAAEAVERACKGTSLTPRVVQLGTNTGFSGGANAGVEHADGDLLVVANLDVSFDCRFLSVLVREAKSDGWHFLAPRVVEGKQHREAGVARRNPSHRYSWVAPPNTTQQVGAGNGSCLVFRAHTLDRRTKTVGGLFDVEYHSFNEDIDLYWWAEHAGLIVRYVPDLAVAHAHAGSFGGDYRFAARPVDVQRRVMANYRVTVWKNARGQREWLGWPLGEASYLGQAVVSCGLRGLRAYVASWADARAVAYAIRHRRGSLRPSARTPSATGRPRRDLGSAGLEQRPPVENRSDVGGGHRSRRQEHGSVDRS